MNNRLLTYNYNDGDSEPLTPNHIISGGRLDINSFNKSSTLLEINPLVEKSIGQFWKLSGC